MRLICFWCAVVATAAQSRDEDYYGPQTFRQVPRSAMFQPLDTPWASSQRTTDVVNPYRPQLFNPASDDVTPQGTTAQSWRPNPPPVYENYNRGSEGPRSENWRVPYGISKEQQAAILHHKQSLSSEGAFRFEYASDNGLAAGEVIEPDGSRVGAYQYKDPSGQLVKLKYRAGKEGFQILEGSHLPKSPEPVPPAAPTGNYYSEAYEQQRRQYDLQQQYNQQRPEPQWQNQAAETQRGASGGSGAVAGAGSQYFNQNWRPDGRDDGQYRDNDIEEQNRGPHSFGGGYAFAFKG
ncbi:uncharacterized protein LOC125074506 [Vanessa atalanta]|uniref:uncharacterized protein LOC125074506 n=1 Tax=Vanessa atalanta TaxID=42275 RepID=UPI001FCCD68A|nr:uncharacterized protein LOC125074506 [Vanessa atalanta]